MDTKILLVIGGIGLFLLGMVLMTDGLKGLAGDRLRRLLSNYTKTPMSGAATGAVATALIQSSSATIITAVGFVGAGLLTFPQALGIIFGANIGTTITGWLVAILGFKLHLGEVVLPLVLLGVMLRLYGSGRVRHIGLSLAGFSLLFFGIDAMQQGMAQFEGAVTPDVFPDNTLFGRFKLLLIGVAITLVTQSSSAGVATALAAIGAGAISFPQAAAMVIGMDVGTTFTAALATIGGSTATRRTGYAHVIYNVMTGVMAFFLLGPYADYVADWISQGGAGNTQISLVAFHTLFNTIGVILILPFVQPFARLITELVPESGPPLLRRLDKRLVASPGSAIDTGLATMGDITTELIGVITHALEPDGKGRPDEARLGTIEEALEATRSYMARIDTADENETTRIRHTAALHILDHSRRLSRRCMQQNRIAAIHEEKQLRQYAALLLSAAAKLTKGNNLEEAGHELDHARNELRQQRRLYRDRTIEIASQSKFSTEAMLERLDSVRWLHRVAYHLWRIAHHLRQAELKVVSEPPGNEIELDLEAED